MKDFKKRSLMFLTTVMMVLSFCALGFADTIITTNTRAPYFRSGNGPVSSVFYFLGDVVVLPFRLVGNLFS